MKKSSKVKVSVGNKPKPMNRTNQNLKNVISGTGRLSLSSGNFNSSTGKKSHLICEDEYIGEINGSVAFATTAFSVNPGLSTCFPWGSRLADLYERYNFLHLEFYYRRQVSEFATNGTSGKVILSFDYDALDSPPTNKQQVEDTDPHVDGMPCTESLFLRLNPSDLKRADSLYIRSGAPPLNSDLKTYDIGKLYVSTQGNVNTSVIGELRVRYKVQVFTPVLNPTALTYYPGSSFAIRSSTLGEPAAATTVFSKILVSTVNSPVVTTNGIGATFEPVLGQILLPSGIYLLHASMLTHGSAVDVTNAIILHNSSVVTAGPVIQTPHNEQAEIAGPALHYPSTSSITALIWDTSILGTSVYLSGKATYASGTATHMAMIYINLI